jgi:hypothetical protein
LHVARRFALFLDTYRRPDGSLWTGPQLDEATGGVVSRSYFVNLWKGRIENPGYENFTTSSIAYIPKPRTLFQTVSLGEATNRGQKECSRNGQAPIPELVIIRSPFDVRSDRRERR